MKKQQLLDQYRHYIINLQSWIDCFPGATEMEIKQANKEIEIYKRFINELDSLISLK